MALEFNKKSNSSPKKTKLSKFGKMIIGTSILLTIFLIILFFNFRNNIIETNALEDEFYQVIVTNIRVIEQNLISSNVDASVMREFENLKSNILNEDDLMTKYDKTLELITFALSHISHNQSAIDELNGTRNRLTFARRELMP